MSSCAVSNESVVKTMIVSPILFLTSEDWFEDYSVCKYQLVHLTVDDPSLSIIDIFMLAASRLGLGGELIVRFNAAFSSISFPTFFVSLGRSFGFEAIASTYNSSSQFSFRFNGPETKLGYQMQLAQTVSDRCIALFKDVFGHAISKEFWHWKYPTDKEVFSVTATKDNRVVAHYGFCSRMMSYNGTALWGAQACDVMVDSGERGALTGSIFNELFSLGERVFYSDYSPISVAYGFPHGRHFKLGYRLKLYSPVSAIWQVAFDIPVSNLEASENHNQTLASKQSLISKSFQSINKAHLEALNYSMTSHCDTTVLKRDYFYLLDRYAHHPEFNYVLYELNDCYFILKEEGNKLFLMDYIGALDHYLNNIDHFLLLLSSKYSGKCLHLWCLDPVADEILDFQFCTTKKSYDTGAMFVIKTYSESLPDFKQWWITMGDTEFL